MSGSALNKWYDWLVKKSKFRWFSELFKNKKEFDSIKYIRSLFKLEK